MTKYYNLIVSRQQHTRIVKTSHTYKATVKRNILLIHSIFDSCDDATLMRVCYLVEVLVEPIHKEQQQLLGVLLVTTSKLVVDLAYGDLKVPRTDALVQASPQGLHDHPKLLRHLPFMAQDVVSGRGTEQRYRCQTSAFAGIFMVSHFISRH